MKATHVLVLVLAALCAVATADEGRSLLAAKAPAPSAAKPAAKPAAAKAPAPAATKRRSEGGTCTSMPDRHMPRAQMGMRAGGNAAARHLC
ncbi:hypothetical protein WJX81_001259 [Elliptochloris bilobata]|uniref:Antifreeze protein n=1 Tax=Elliptochloris bilobata TaxID=381761 RepID=A0AAW1R3R1_9CHLO